MIIMFTLMSTCSVPMHDINSCLLGTSFFAYYISNAHLKTIRNPNFYQ